MSRQSYRQHKTSKKQGRSKDHGSRYACERLEDRVLLSLVAPVFHSNPGATAKLYLNFVGSQAFDWGGTRAHGPGSNDAPIPGFTMDGDANNFSQAEINVIANIFGIVSEKFSPFNLDVTTQDPGNRTHGVTITDHIGGSNSDWYGKGGGVSEVGSFTNTNLVPDIFAWTGDFNWSTPGGITFSTDFAGGNTIPHEAGHAFGLGHQRTPGAPGQPVNEYYNGDATRSPIMGNSANGGNVSKRGMWWLTNMEPGQQSPDPVQDDLAVIASANNGFGYRSDDWSYSHYFTMPLAADGSLGPVNGTIENTADVDPFRFTSPGTTGTFTITSILSAVGGGMLQPSGRLVDASTFQPIPFSIVSSGTTATLSSSSMVPGHDYYIEVRSFGNYGDVGQYFVSGNLQGFASYDPASRTVTVRGLAGNNNVTLSESYGIQNRLIVEDSLNGGPTSSQMFLLSGVDSVSVNLGGGDDTLNWTGLVKGDFVTDIPVYTSMGGGFDTLKLGGGSTYETFNVGEILTELNFAGVRTSTLWNFDAERVELHGTNGGSDTFNINAQNNYSTIYAYGGAGGNDRCVIGPAVMASSDPSVFFYGAGSGNTLELNGSTLGFNQSFTVFNNTVQRFVPGNPFASEVHFDSAVQTISIKGGAGDDNFNLQGLAAGQTLIANGNDGADAFRVGNSNSPIPAFNTPFTSSILGTILVLAGAGNDLLYVDDVAYTGGANGFWIGSSVLYNTVTNGSISYDATLERLDFHASNAGSRFVTLGGIPATMALNLFGGIGAGDTLIVDDRTLHFVPFRVDVGADYYKEYYGTPQNPTIVLLPPTSGFENFRVVANDNTTAINIMALPAGVFTQVTGGFNTDAVTVYPHDAGGNLSINGGLYVNRGGGSAKLIIDDTGQANPIDYVFTNTFGGLIDQINGLGAGTVTPASDIQNIVIKGGDGGNTFDFNQHKLAANVSIYGGAGNDTLNFGGSNLAANIGNTASFLFDGQGGYNTLNLFDVNDGTGSYARNVGAVSYFNGAGTYSISLSEANTQLMNIYPSSDGPTVSMVGVVPGTTTAVYFNTPVNLGVMQFGFGSKKLLGIQGAVIFDGGINGSSISVLDSLDTTDRIVHLTQSTLGAFPGDDLFPSGGSLTFTNIRAGSHPGLNLILGSGADTLYVQPNLTGTITVAGGGPTIAPGDTLNLALADAQNYVLNGTVASGSVTSDNLKTVTYSGFEAGPNTDDVAPAVVAANLNVDGAPAVPGSPSLGAAAPAPSPGGPSLDVQFSENVALLLGTASIQLTNLTTGQVVPQAFLAMTYDPATKTARFTFPGYPNGTPPDGNYGGRILATSTDDLFGNALAADASFDFFILAGDANHDRHLDETDQAILNAHLGQAAPSTFSQGDFNYDNAIDAADTAILNANLHVWLPPQGNLSVSFPAGDASYRLKAESGFLLDLYTTAAPTPTYRIPVGALSGLTFITSPGATDTDTLMLDFSSGLLPTAGITVLGRLDTLAIVGTLGDDALTASPAGIIFGNGVFGSIPITAANIRAIQFHGGGTGGNDSINFTGGSYTIDADTLTGAPNVSVTVGPTAIANFATDQHLASLTLNGGVANLSTARHSMVVNALAITNNGLLDIANSFLYLNNTATSFATVKTYLDAAYNLYGLGNLNAPYAGDYKGVTGITSSVAKASYATDEVNGLGYYNGAQQDPTNPDTVGQIYGPDSNSGHGTGIPLSQILIRPTLTGDLNGDGVVNSYDVGLFNTYGLFNTGPTPLGWQAGDLNGDGVVDSKDVTIFNTVGNFNNGSYPSAALPSVPAVRPAKAAAVGGVVSGVAPVPVVSSFLAALTAEESDVLLKVKKGRSLFHSSRLIAK